MKKQLVLAAVILLSLGTAISATMNEADVPAYSASETAPEVLMVMQSHAPSSYSGTLARPL